MQLSVQLCGSASKTVGTLVPSVFLLFRAEYVVPGSMGQDRCWSISHLLPIPDSREVGGQKGVPSWDSASLKEPS